MADLFQTNVTIGRFGPCNITVMGKWTMPWWCSVIFRASTDCVLQCLLNTLPRRTTTCLRQCGTVLDFTWNFHNQTRNWKGAILSYIIDAVLNYNSTVLSQFQLLLRPKIIFEKLTWYNSEEKISKVENCFLGNLLTSIEKRISTKTKPPSFR